VICYPDTTDWSCWGTPEDISTLDPDKKALSEARAWYTLAAMTAYRIGVCPTTIRPCSRGCAPAGSWIAAPASATGANMGALPLQTIGGIFTPHITGGVWVNSCRCGSVSDCSCGSSLSAVILPGPVGAIESVVLNGELVDPTKYRVDNGNELISLDPDIVWPSCQNMTADLESDGTFAVTYYRGMAPNEMVNSTAGVLAAEFYKACTGGKCRLPQNVKQVVRYGVTIEVNPDLFSSMMVIPEVAMLVNVLNPNQLKQAPRVLSPDGPSRPRMQTWGR
jgi:hypothetical protein